jgi:hypothetical protein
MCENVHFSDRVNSDLYKKTRSLAKVYLKILIVIRSVLLRLHVGSTDCFLGYVTTLFRL